MGRIVNKLPRIIFFGTPEIAVSTLKFIHQEFGLIAVVTNPDKEQGRGRKLLPCEVKLAAQSFNIPTIEPVDLKSEEFANSLKVLNPDIFVVFAYKILPSWILAIPKIGSFNIHPSLLPKYRGAAPINHAIINGDLITGISTFLMEEKVDAGGILLQEEFSIPENSTAGDLAQIVKHKAPKIALKTIKMLLSGNLKIIKQDNNLVTKAPKLFKENCKIDFNQPAENVKNFINGVSPEPAAWTIWNGQQVKFYRSIVNEETIGLKPNEFKITNKNFHIGCADKEIKILEIQLPTKKIMKILEFLNGYKGELNGKFN